ncbi:M28 family peptidase [Candidatus Pacearchaeota archaeon]|nr:M28 family peptidase [Candidatus Pacearchaeota archaeon]
MNCDGLIDIVKTIEGKTDSERRAVVLDYLSALNIPHEVQTYNTGKNVIGTVKNLAGDPEIPIIGIGSHYDVVPCSPGANDNASAMAVTIDVLRKVNNEPMKNIEVCGFFFDEEECGLKGSWAYIDRHGIDRLIGVYNMELVGSGDNLVFWTENKMHNGLLLKTIEDVASNKGVRNYCFPLISRFLQNSGDQESFSNAGLKETFCITAIPDKDIEMCLEYGLVNDSRFKTVGKVVGFARMATKARNFDTNMLLESDLFKHYHQRSDTSRHLSDDVMQNLSDILYESIQTIDKKYS